ncbi:MAG: glycosyltransferase [Clostridia bacterium]|nr:glycosyltransferase [Clostridia bacterium]MBQ8859675.1 glycosyltransferase [Clostridia bacterium]
MNILMLTDRLAIGGAETHIYELSRALRGAGHTVKLAAAEGAFSARLRREGFSVYSLPLADKRPRELLHARRGLFRLLQSGHFDIVHAHARLPAFLVAPLCRRCGIPLVCTAHWVFDPHGWRGHFSEWGERSFAVSEDIKAYLVREYGIPPAHITVIENGIDTEAFAPMRRKNGGQLLHISRLDTGRASCAEALVGCAEELAGSGLCRSLTIVGDGDRFSSICADADEKNRKIGFDFIHMVGAVTDVRPFLYEADLFVGVSRAALEAMATALPVILAGDEGYLSLLTEETKNAAIESNLCCRGTLPLSPERLVSDILAALASPRLRSLGEWGAALVGERYGIGRMADKTVAVYREATKKRPRITICGYFGKQNTGDDAALAFLCKRLTSEGFSDICILGNREQGGQHPIRGRWAAFSPNLFSQGGIFILGGGNLLQNETSNRSLFYYTHLFRRAKQAGMKTVVLGGIGKLNTHGECTVRRALASADGFLMRTPRDVTAATELSGGARPVRLLSDGALWLEAKNDSKFVLPQNNAVLFALRGSERSWETAKRLAQRLYREWRLTPVFAVMQAGRDEVNEMARDIPAARMLPHLPPEELVSVMRSCRIVVGDRLHALILAAVAGIPAVGISDDGKIDAFCDFCDSVGGGKRITAVPFTEEGVLAAVGGALSLPPSDGALLAQLRQSWENFSFADFFALL